MLAELARREKEENIEPDPDPDIYMKVGWNLLSIIHLEIVALNLFFFLTNKIETWKLINLVYIEKGMRLSRLMIIS